MAIKNIEHNKETNTIIIEYEFKGKEWDQIFAKTKKQKIKELKIPGFRPGKAPQHEINRRITPVVVAYDAIEEAFKKEAEGIYKEAKEKYKNIVGQPVLIDLPVLGEDASVVKIKYPLLPDFSKYKISDVKVKPEKVSVTTSEIDEKIKEKLKDEILLFPIKKTEKTKKGDVVIINYKGYVKDVPFDGGEAEGFELKLGSGTFIGTFEEQLMDKKVGWKGEVKVKFPDNYPVDTLKGQDAVFQTEIVDAKRPEEVILNDEKIKSMNIPGITTLKQMQEVIKKELTVLKTINELNITLAKVVKELKEKHKPVIDDIIAVSFAEKKMEEVKQELKKQGIKLSEYLDLLEKTEEQFFKLVLEEEKDKLLNSLIGSNLFESVENKLKTTDDHRGLWAVETSMRSGLPLEMIMTFAFPKKDSKEKNGQALYESAVKEITFKEYVAEQLDSKIAEANKKAAYKIVDEKIKEAKKAKEEFEKKSQQKEEVVESKPVKEEKSKAKKTTTKKASTTKKTKTSTKQTKKETKSKK